MNYSYRELFWFKLLKILFGIFISLFFLSNPSAILAIDANTDPNVSLLQNRISNNFSKKYCKAVENGFSKDEAMKSAIVKT